MDNRLIPRGNVVHQGKVPPEPAYVPLVPPGEGPKKTVQASPVPGYLKTGESKTIAAAPKNRFATQETLDDFNRHVNTTEQRWKAATLGEKLWGALKDALPIAAAVAATILTGGLAAPAMFAAGAIILGRHAWNAKIFRNTRWNERYDPKLLKAEVDQHFKALGEVSENELTDKLERLNQFRNPKLTITDLKAYEKNFQHYVDHNDVDSQHEVIKILKGLGYEVNLGNCKKEQLPSDSVSAESEAPVANKSYEQNAIEHFGAKAPPVPPHDPHTEYQLAYQEFMKLRPDPNLITKFNDQITLSPEEKAALVKVKKALKNLKSHLNTLFENNMESFALYLNATDEEKKPDYLNGLKLNLENQSEIMGDLPNSLLQNQQSLLIKESLDTINALLLSKNVDEQTKAQRSLGSRLRLLSELKQQAAAAAAS